MTVSSISRQRVGIEVWVVRLWSLYARSEAKNMLVESEQSRCVHLKIFTLLQSVWSRKRLECLWSSLLSGRIKLVVVRKLCPVYSGQVIIGHPK